MKLIFKILTIIKISVLLVTFISTGCSINIGKAVEEGLKKESVTRWEKILTNDKVPDDLKIDLIRKISQPDNASNFINDYLSDMLYPRYKNTYPFEQEVINGLINQNNTANTRLFIILLENNHQQKEDLKKAIVSFGNDGFKLWKDYIPRARDHFRDDIVDVFDKMPEKGMNLLLSLYLERTDQQDKLVYYFNYFHEESAKVIKDNILNNTISSYNDISSIITALGPQQLSRYIDVFRSHNDNHIAIMTSIFTHFKNESIAALMEFQPLLDDLQSRLIIYDICQKINTPESFSLLEKFLESSVLEEESREIIEKITNMSRSFPSVFIPFLDKPDVNSYVIRSLEKFLQSDPSSVIQAFDRATNDGKIVLINALCVNNMGSESIQRTIFEKYRQLDDSVIEFLIHHLPVREFKDYHHEVVHYSLRSLDRRLYSKAILISKKNYEQYNSYIINNYQSLISGSQGKRIELISYFERTPVTNNLNLLLSLYARNYGVDKILSRQYGSALINNTNINLVNLIANEYPVFRTSALRSQERSRLDSLLYLLNLSKNNSLNNSETVIDRVINYYGYADLDSRIRIIDFLAKSRNRKLFKFLAERYDDMSLLERSLFNNTLVFFETDTIIDHLKKLTYLKEGNDFYTVKNLLDNRYDKFDLTDDMLSIFIFHYFAENRFEKVDEFGEILRANNRQYQDIKKAIEYWRKTEVLADSALALYSIEVSNIAKTYKTLVESIIANQSLAELTHSRRLSSQYSLNADEHRQQFQYLKDQYHSFFVYLDSDHTATLQGNLLSSLINAKSEQDIRIGLRSYIPKEGNAYLIIDLEVKNLYPEPAIIDFRDFYLSSIHDKYYVNEITLIYARFKGLDINYALTVLPQNKQLITMVFEVPVNLDRLLLKYDNENLTAVSLPISVPLY